METHTGCCGCLSMRNAVTAMGVLTLVQGTADILFGSIYLNDNFCTRLHAHDHDDDEDDDDSKEDFEDNYDDDNFSQHICNDSQWIYITAVAVGVVAIVVSSMLLYGTTKRKPNFLLAYMIMMIFNTIGYSITAFACFVAGYRSFTLGVIYLLLGSVSAYFASVVKRYRELMITQRIVTHIVVANPGWTPVATEQNQAALYPTAVTVYSDSAPYTAPGSRPPTGGYPSTPPPCYATQAHYPVAGPYSTAVGCPPRAHYPPPGSGTPSETIPPPYPGYYSPSNGPALGNAELPTKSAPFP